MWRSLPAFALAVLFLAPAPAAADPFTPRHALLINFESPGYAPIADTLILQLGLLTVVEPVVGFTASLYDGSRLLGTNTLHLFDGHVGPLHLDLANIFVAPGTPRIHSLLPQTEVDFGSLLAGTIDGRVVFAIGAGAILLNLDTVSLSVSHTHPDGTGTGLTPSSLTSVEIAAVPEPGTLLLVGGGAALAALRRRRAAA